MSGTSWKIARSRRSAVQLPLVICCVLALVIVLLGKAESSIFDNVRAKLTDWAAPILVTVRAPLAQLESWVDAAGSIFTVHAQNVRLRQENAELRKWRDAALALERRVNRYELLLHAVPDVKTSAITARVIGHSSRPFIKTLILNAGASNGVKKGQAVLNEHGLIGRIYLAGERTAWVILLSDINSRIPVRTASSNRRAILVGDNSLMPQLELDGALDAGEISAGDRVVTTGDGGFLPTDLPIGSIVMNGNAVRVALVANPDVSDFVQVLDYSVPPMPAPDASYDLPAMPESGDQETQSAAAPSSAEISISTAVAQAGARP